MLKNHLSLLISIGFLFSQISFARSSKGLNIEQSLLANEYVFKTSPTQKMMPIRLISGTKQPGIYHIPQGTRLTSLIALSGGKTKDDLTSKIMIKRAKESVKFNLDDFIEKGKGADPVLKPGDIVSIPKHEPFISSDTLTTSTFVASIFSIILTGYLISEGDDD